MYINRRNNPYSGIIVLYGTTEGCIITAQQLPTEKEVKESQDFIESQCLFQVVIGKFPKKSAQQRLYHFYITPLYTSFWH
jgi:hypothetical protein